MNINPLVLFHGDVPSPAAPVYVSPGGVIVVRRCLFVSNVASSATLVIDGAPIFWAEPMGATSDTRRKEQELAYRLPDGATIEAGAGAPGALTLLIEAFELT